MLIDNIKKIVREWKKSRNEESLENFYELMKKMIKAVVYRNYMDVFCGENEVEEFAHECATNMVISLREGRIKRINSSYISMYVRGFVEFKRKKILNRESDDVMCLYEGGDKVANDGSKNMYVYVDTLIDIMYREINRIGEVMGLSRSFGNFVALGKMIGVDYSGLKRVDNRVVWVLGNVAEYVSMGIRNYRKEGNLLSLRRVFDYSVAKKNDKIFKVLMKCIKNRIDDAGEFLSSYYIKRIKNENVLFSEEEKRLFERMGLI